MVKNLTRSPQKGQPKQQCCKRNCVPYIDAAAMQIEFVRFRVGRWSRKYGENDCRSAPGKTMKICTGRRKGVEAWPSNASKEMGINAGMQGRENIVDGGRSDITLLASLHPLRSAGQEDSGVKSFAIVKPEPDYHRRQEPVTTKARPRFQPAGRVGVSISSSTRIFGQVHPVLGTWPKRKWSIISKHLG